MQPSAPVPHLNSSIVSGHSALSWAAQMHREKGFALLREGKMREASEELKQTIDESAAEPLILLNLAIAYMNLKNWIEAGRALCAYLKCRPRDAMAHVRLGVVLFHLKKHEPALRQFKRALRLNPACIAAYCHSGDVLAAMRRLQQASAAYQRALDLKPSYAAALMGLADLRAQRGLCGPAMTHDVL
jgi:tetratricopeptide (TPR) repeat protein